MAEIVLKFSERVSLANADAELARHQQELNRASLQAGARVVADLSMLKEVDTSALAVILQLDRQVRQRLSQPMRIRSAPANLFSLARLSSLESVLDFEQGLEPKL